MRGQLQLFQHPDKTGAAVLYARPLGTGDLTFERHFLQHFRPRTASGRVTVTATRLTNTYSTLVRDVFALAQREKLYIRMPFRTMPDRLVPDVNRQRGHERANAVQRTLLWTLLRIATVASVWLGIMPPPTMPAPIVFEVYILLPYCSLMVPLSLGLAFTVRDQHSAKGRALTDQIVGFRQFLTTGDAASFDRFVHPDPWRRLEAAGDAPDPD